MLSRSSQDLKNAVFKVTILPFCRGRNKTVEPSFATALKMLALRMRTMKEL